jgi:hypothetical protein
MLGSIGEPSRHFCTASDEDLNRMNTDEKTFLDKAQGLLDELERRTTVFGSRDFGEGKGSVFAFPNGKNRPNTLLVNDSKLVYTTQHMTFISNRERSILNSAERVVPSTPRAPVVDRP